MFEATLLPYAKYVIMFVQGFMCIPTGRDFFVPGKPIMPGDEKLLAVMNRDPIASPTAAFMWRVFGFMLVVVVGAASAETRAEDASARASSGSCLL